MGKIDELKKVTDAPVVVSNNTGLVVYANSCFLKTYQWTEELIGTSLNRIIPTAFHDSHNMGFSRFLVTGKSKISDHPIEAAVVMGSGVSCWSKHLIVVEQIGGEFLIGAKIIPVDSGFEQMQLQSSSTSSPVMLPVIDELRETIGKMEVALSEIEDAIVWTDGSGEIRWCNRAFDNLVGRSHLSILGAELSDLLQLKAQFSSGEGGEEGSKDPIRELLASEHNRREFQAEIQGKMEILEISCSEFSLRDSQKSLIVALRLVTRERKMANALAASRKRMAEELEIGREIQLSLLPANFYEEPEFCISASYQPALELGGDFYSHYFTRKDQLCFCVGDVSGKGVPAALFMAVAQTMIRNHAYGGKSSTANIISQVNETIVDHNPANMFFSLFVGILDIKSGHLIYTNAGHNPPFYKRSMDSFELLNEKHGPVVGISDEVVYEQGAIEMAPGDTLLVYTDGVTEAIGEKGDWYTAERFADFLTNTSLNDPQDLVAAVAEEMNSFKGKGHQADDITLMCLQFRGSSPR